MLGALFLVLSLVFGPRQCPFLRYVRHTPCPLLYTTLFCDGLIFIRVCAPVVLSTFFCFRCCAALLVGLPWILGRRAHERLQRRITEGTKEGASCSMQLAA